MTTVFMLLTLQCLLGGYDNLRHHEIEADLPHTPTARSELALHAARELLYAAILGGLAWVQWHGAWAAVFASVLVAEVLITLTDFVVEDRTRRLPPAERVLHALLALNYGAVLMALAPVLLAWLRLPSELRAVDHGAWSWLMSLFALGVFAWGLRNVFAVARLGVPQWQREPLRRGVSGTPRSVLVTGGSGFVGRALVRHLVARGDRVLVLSRHVERTRDRFGPWVEVIGSLDALGDDSRVDAIVNLAGESIAGGWWTQAHKRRCVESRVHAAEDVVRLLRRLQRRPAVLINASAVGYYGDRGDEWLDERSGARAGFLSELCQRWEAATDGAAQLGLRVCRLRIGLVLGAGGGVLGPMAASARFGAGAVLGKGQQWMPWVHIDDVVGLIEHALCTRVLQGPLNAVAPQAVTQAGFMRQLARTLRRPLLLRVPAPLLRRLAGDMSTLFLVSQRVVPRMALETGYRFMHPELDAALRRILQSPLPAAARIYVNRDCAVCRTQMDRYDGIAQRLGCALEFRPVSAARDEVADYGLQPRDLRRRLFVRTADGGLLSGIDAGLAIWAALPRRAAAVALLRLPGVHALCEMLYDLICAPLLSWWNERRGGMPRGEA